MEDITLQNKGMYLEKGKQAPGNSSVPQERALLLWWPRTCGLHWSRRLEVSVRDIWGIDSYLVYSTNGEEVYKSVEKLRRLSH